jgi:hypothetical protein
MGYDERGHCPMFVDGGCSIYEHRPRTCRTYDCRVFAGAGVAPDDDKPLIVAQARRWRFSYATPEGKRRHEVARAVAVRLRSKMDADGRVGSVNATQLAVHAVEAPVGESQLPMF